MVLDFFDRYLGVTVVLKALDRQFLDFDLGFKVLNKAFQMEFMVAGKLNHIFGIVFLAAYLALPRRVLLDLFLESNLRELEYLLVC